MQPWHQHLVDHFSNMAEDKMIANHSMSVRGVRSAYLKDLFEQWRGLQTGYDEGLMRGDAVLATAVWRNMFGGDPQVDFRSVGEVVSYMRHVLKLLQDLPDEDVASGEISFEGNPSTERDGVLVRSRLMDMAAKAQAQVKAQAQGQAAEGVPHSKERIKVESQK